MARLDTIRALEKRGLSPELAEKTVDLGYLLGTLKNADLKTLRKEKKLKETFPISQNRKLRSQSLIKLKQR